MVSIMYLIPPHPARDVKKSFQLIFPLFILHTARVKKHSTLSQNWFQYFFLNLKPWCATPTYNGNGGSTSDFKLIVFNFGPIFFFYVLKIYPRSFGFIHVNNYSCLVYFRPSLLSNFQKNNSSFIKQNFQNMHSTVFLSLLIEMGQSYYSETILFIHVLLQNRGLQTKKNQLRTLAPKYIFYQAGVYFLPRS